MKRVELKRIPEFLWKGSRADEKTPFAAQGALPDNGSFAKNLEAGEIEKAGKEIPKDEDENSESPMSLPRKLCFVMSFNVWILYFLVLGWLLPCRHLECGFPVQEKLERNLSTIWLLTNVETMNVKGLPSLAIFGYADGMDEKLSALASVDATFEWNISLPFNPKNIQCNFQNTFDANLDGIPDCVLSGYNDVCAFNASNGYIFWHQSLPSEKGNILGGFHPTAVRNNETYLIGTCGDKMIALNGETGNKTFEINLPCDAPFEIKVVRNPLSGNSTLWSLVCDYGDTVEAWSLRELDVLIGEKLESEASDFALLFRGSNSGGSIDLGCDVTPIPGGPLLLSWSDRVAMVTPEATAWERHFPSPLTVASIKVGHFSSKDVQAAAAIHNGTHTIVVVMEMMNGSIIDSITLKNRQAQSLDKIPDSRDLLVLKSLYFGNSAFQQVNNFSDPIPWEQTNFVLIDFSGGTFKIRDIVTTSKVVGSVLSTQASGETDLLVITTDDGDTYFHKYVIHGSETQNVLCVGSNHMSHYSFES